MRDPDETQISDDTGPKLRYERVAEGGVVCLRLEGTIDEQFDGAAMLNDVGAGPLLLHLAGIDKISSFGIREWVDFMAHASGRAAAVYFVECSPKVVDQLNMVANFAGSAKVVSFFAPYRCDYCDDERRRLLQVDVDRDAIKSARMPDRTCEACGNAEYFDEDPLTFFSHLQQQPPLTLPDEVQAFLTARSAFVAVSAGRKIKLEKLIDERATFVRIAGDLDAGFPRDKLAEGLEGEAIFDLGGLGKIDPAGATEWRRFIAAITPAVEKIRFIDCPPAFLERLGAPEDLGPKVEVLSFQLPYTCDACRRAVARTIEVAGHFATLRFATAPELSCEDCKKPLACAASDLLLSHMAALQEPKLDASARAQIGRFQSELAKRRAAPAPVVPAPAPQLPPKPLAAPSGRPFAIAAAVSALAVLVALAAFALVASSVWKSKPAKMGDELVAASDPTVPPWIEVRSTRDGDRHFFVGKGEAGNNDRVEALERADDAAFDELAAQLGTEARSVPFTTHVVPLFRGERERALGELDRARAAGDTAELERAHRVVYKARHRVAEALRRSAAGLLPVERSDMYWELLSSSQGPHMRAFTRWVISDDAWRKLVERYAAVEAALGTRVATWFPSLGWRFEPVAGVIVVGIEDASAVRLGGVQEGDLVLKVLERPVNDAPSWKRLVDEETARLADTGAALVLEVQRGAAAPFQVRVRVDARPVDKGEKPAKPEADPKKRPEHDEAGARPTKRKGNVHGNIWDDNPDE